MPKSTISQDTKLETRSAYTKVDCVISVSLDGNELPNLEVMGKAFEQMITEFQQTIKDSYKQIPDRITSI